MRENSNRYPLVSPFPRWRMSATGVILAACISLGAQCDGPPNLNTIEVSGPSGTTKLTTSDLPTALAWTAEQFTPPYGDRPGSTQKITWTPGFKNFELIAFDARYDPASSPMGVAGAGFPMLGENFGKPAAFVSLRNGGSREFRLDYTIQHLIQYWHGECSLRMKWSDVFNYISTQLLGAYSCGLKQVHECQFAGSLVSATREHEFYEPHFSSQGRYMEWGFALHSHLRTRFAALNAGSIDMQPAFVLSRDSNTGRIGVKDVQHNVVVFNDTAGHKIKRSIERQIAKATRDLNAQLSTMKMDVAAECSTAGAPLERQQQDCYHQVVEKRDAGTALMLRLLGWLRYGGDAQSARMIAEYAQQGFEPGDFTCERSKCMFNPYVHELNVLPHELELVVATEEEATWDRRMLFELFDVALQTGSIPQFPIPARVSCDSRYGQSTGYVTEARYGRVGISTTPPDGITCPPIECD